MKKALSRGVHCTPFEYTVLCLKATQVHFPLQAEDGLLLLLVMGRHIAKVGGRKKRDPLTDGCTVWIFLQAFAFERHFFERVCGLSPERGLFC